MAKKVAQGGDPALSIEFFTSGFYTYRSQLFAPFRNIGINVVSFRDPVLDGENMELTDKFEWSRRPGFSIFCSEPLADSEVVNQFYSSRNLEGEVVDFLDTTHRLSTFTTTEITTLLEKTTTDQGYVQTVGDLTYFADGAAVDYLKWDGTHGVPWGLAAPNTAPTVSGQGFWQQETSFPLADSIQDTNGNIENVTAIINPNGTVFSPANAENMAFGGSSESNWVLNPATGGWFSVNGWQHIQQAQNYSISGNGTIVTTFTANVTMGNVILVEIAGASTNFTPAITSVTDNLGNTYSVQASGTEIFHGGGGNNYLISNWLYSAPITTGGACTITVVSTNNQLGVIVHEIFGISATASATATRGGFNGSSMATPISFSGTQFVLSSIAQISAIPNPTPPSGYTVGGSLIFSQLYDAYAGATTSSTPTWFPFGSPPGSYIALAIAASFTINTLTTGYTPYLFLYNFNNGLGNLVPASATITGVVLNVPRQNLGGGSVTDQSVKMVIAGSPTGTSQAAATIWSSSGISVQTYGSPTNVWGTSVTAAQINASGTGGFGFVISADVTSTTGGSVIPEVELVSPNAPTLTIYFTLPSGLGGPGISGINEPIWSTTINGTIYDGGIAWTNYGPIQQWFPATGFTTPVVVLDNNGFLELATNVVNTVAAWNSGTTYSVGSVVYFGGSYWVSLIGSNLNIVPSTSYIVTTTSGSTATGVPAWALTQSPLVTGLITPVWSTTVGGTTTDGSFTWTNIGQGTLLATVGYGYVFGYRTIYGHLTTASPVSANTGAILGPLQASIQNYTITSNVVTFTGSNNFVVGNVFQPQGLTFGTYLNEQSLTVTAATPSQTFPLTSVSVTSNVVTITAINNLKSGQNVSFSSVANATFLNGITLTVLSSGLSGTQFEANLTHANYGPTADTGEVELIGTFTANFTHANVSLQPDSGVAAPLIATITGLGTDSALCNSVATITKVAVSGNVVTVTASNNFQPGLWVTIASLTGAAFLNNQQVQVSAVDQPVGTQNTYFQFIFVTPNYAATADSGTATFNAVEIYRTSDGGGTYLFDGAVTNPALGANAKWIFNDFTSNADLDELLIAPLAHLNDPPPGAPGSLVPNVGNVLTYWQGRLWMCVGNYVYMDAGPDCTNGVPEESWPPSYRFQFAGPTLGLERTADGTALLVYLADRVGQILGGPETISFYPADALSNFGISSTNSLFRDGSVIGQFVTQGQYVELIGDQKQDIGEHIADYLDENFDSAKTYVTLHRDGLDVGVFISNGIDRVLRYGTNVNAWSVPAFPAFGAGAMNSIETSVGTYSLMLAAPAGSKTSALGPLNPDLGANISGALGPAWLNPSNIEVGNPTNYATTTFTGASTSQILRASAYPIGVPSTSVVQGVTLSLVGNQNVVASTLNVTVTPTAGGVSATSHTFQFGSSNTTEVFGNASDLWNMPWSQPVDVNEGAISFDITATYTGATPGSAGLWAGLDVDAISTGTSATTSTGPLTPNQSGEIAVFMGFAAANAFGPPPGFAQMFAGSLAGGLLLCAAIQPTAAPLTVTDNLGSSKNWATILAFFHTAATSFTANITQVSLTSNVVTVTCANGFNANTQAICTGLTGATFLNGQTLVIATASPTQFTAPFVHGNYGPTADSGTATDFGIVQSMESEPGNVNPATLTFTNPVTAGNTVLALTGGHNAGGFGAGYGDITSIGGTVTGGSWTIINSPSGSTFSPHVNMGIMSGVTGGSSVVLNFGASAVGADLIILEIAGGTFVPEPVVSISEAQVIVTYQNPGNYLYARDVNSWGDAGSFGENDGSPYADTFITLGSITLTPPGAPLIPVQHIVGYFDAVGDLNQGGPSVPNISILPNEFQPSTLVPFVQLPEFVQEPPEGVNHPSQTLLSLRWPLSMMNSDQASQMVHHLQVKIEFEPENAPNTIKALAFKEEQI